MDDAIQVFADVGCPFAYVGIHRLLAARDAARSARRVRIRAWPLEWINGAPLDPQHVAQEVEDLRAQVTPQLFAGFDVGTYPRASIPAFGLAAAGYDTGDAIGEALSLAIRDPTLVIHHADEHFHIHDAAGMEAFFAAALT